MTPKVSFSRCGLLPLCTEGGVSSIARVPTLRAAAPVPCAAAVSRLAGWRARPRFSSAAVGLSACREL